METKRLIDANALGRDAFHIKQWGKGIRCVVDWDDIEAAPTVNAVEVVRCMNCKGSNNAIKRPEGRCLCERISRWVFPDDFCSLGERRYDG